MKQKRLAIQISGHLRTFKETFESFRKYIVEPNERAGWKIDVFIHTWDHTDHSDIVHHNKSGEQRGTAITEEDKEFIQKTYAPADIKITPQLKTDDARVLIKHNGGEVPFSVLMNVYYTKYMANELRRKFESHADALCDLVLCTRADVEYYSEFRLDQYIEEFKSKLSSVGTMDHKLFYSGGYSSSLIESETLLAGSDIVYFGTPGSINEICDLYKNLEDENLDADFLSFEQYKVFYARKHEIEPVNIGFKRFEDWQIVRPEEQRKNALNSARHNGKKKWKSLFNR